VTGVEDEPSDELDVEVELELEVALEAVLLEAVDLVDVVDVVAGMVWALTTPNKPTPATALKATPAVSLFSKRIAASRA
jgi:hypothetical protein